MVETSPKADHSKISHSEVHPTAILPTLNHIYFPFLESLAYRPCEDSHKQTLSLPQLDPYRLSYYVPKAHIDLSGRSPGLLGARESFQSAVIRSMSAGKERLVKFCRDNVACGALAGPKKFQEREDSKYDEDELSFM